MKGLYPSLQMISGSQTTIQMLGWWEYAQKYPERTRQCRVAIKLLYSCHRLKSCKFRNKETADPFCDKCDSMYVESAEHILFACPVDKEKRETLIHQLERVCPPALYSCFMSMSMTEKTEFFLSGMHNIFVPEWAQIYSTILDYINDVYFTRGIT